MNKNTDISGRLSEIIENLNVNANSFAKQLGYKRSQTVYDVLGGKINPGYDFFRRFVISEYSERFNIEWLLAGKGSMLCSDKPAIASNVVNEKASSYGNCPLCKEKDRMIDLLNAQAKECREQLAWMRQQFDATDKNTPKNKRRYG